MPEHDALTFLRWVASELQDGRNPAVDADEFAEHVERLGRYVLLLERKVDAA